MSMMVSTFLDEFKRTRGVRIRLKKDGHLNFKGNPLSYADKILFGAHRKEVVEYLRTQRDVPLSPVLTQETYHAAGLVQLVAEGAWTHPLGDEHAARILTGMIDFEEAKKHTEQRARQADALKRARLR